MSQTGRSRTFSAAVWVKLLVFAVVSVLAAVLFAPHLAHAMPFGNGKFAPSGSDYSVHTMLTQMLGNIVTTSGSITAPGTLGAVFRAFNSGVAFFGGIMVMFVSIVGTVQTAQDGEFLGRKWSSMWVPVRFAGAAAMLLPVTSSGYSLIQAFVLWVALQGVGFADHVWSAVLDTVGLKSAVSIQASVPAESIATTVMRGMLCETALNRMLADSGAPPGSDEYVRSYSSNTTNPMTAQQPIMTSFGAPGVEGREAECGRISYHVPRPNSTAGIEAAQSAIEQAHMQAIQHMIAQFGPIASRYVAGLYDNASYQSGTLAKAVQSAAKVYERTLVSAGSAALSQANDKANSDYIIEMKNAGWVTAGSLYFDLARRQNGVEKAIETHPAVQGPAPDVAQLVTGQTDQHYAEAQKELTNELVALRAAPPPVSSGGATITDNSAVGLLRSGTSPKAITASLSQRFDEGIMNTFFGVNTNESVLMQIKSDGDRILDMAGGLVTLNILGHAAEGGASGFVNSWMGHLVDFVTLGSENTVNRFLNGLLRGVTPFMIAAVYALVTLGVILAVLIPMMPFILWTMGVVGWLILVIEALVAGPLWMVMHMHPSGDGIAGDRAQSGYMLLLVLFMRPALMLMGLAGGIFIVEPAIHFLNETFFTAMRAVQSDSLSGLFILLGFTTVYAILALVIVQKCFSLIHIIPDRVLRWIGGGDAQLGESDAEHHARGAVVAVMSGTRQVAAAGHQALNNMGGGTDSNGGPSGSGGGGRGGDRGGLEDRVREGPGPAVHLAQDTRGQGVNDADD